MGSHKMTSCAIQLVMEFVPPTITPGIVNVFLNKYLMVGRHLLGGFLIHHADRCTLGCCHPCYTHTHDPVEPDGWEFSGLREGNYTVSNISPSLVFSLLGRALLRCSRFCLPGTPVVFSTTPQSLAPYPLPLSALPGTCYSFLSCVIEAGVSLHPISTSSSFISHHPQSGILPLSSLILILL